MDGTQSQYDTQNVFIKILDVWKQLQATEN